MHDETLPVHEITKKIRKRTRRGIRRTITTTALFQDNERKMSDGTLKNGWCRERQVHI